MRTAEDGDVDALVSGGSISLAVAGVVLMPAMDWRDKAACRDEDPELFFPLGSTGPAAEQIRRAKQVCAGCPARLQCLDWAVVTGQHDGVWGGLSEDERRGLRRQR